MATCIITGIGAGIGKAVAIKLAEIGQFDKIAVIGRNEKDIENTIMEMHAKSPNTVIKSYLLDLASPEKIPEVVDVINDELGDIECLLNIAGYTDPQSLLNTTLDSFELTYRVNVFSPFMLMRETVKRMRRSGGKILNVASTAGMTPRPGW